MGIGVNERSLCVRLAGVFFLMGFLIGSSGTTSFFAGDDLVVLFVGDFDLAAFFATAMMFATRIRKWAVGTCGQTEEVVLRKLMECCPYNGLHSTIYLSPKSAIFRRWVQNDQSEVSKMASNRANNIVLP